LVLTPHDREFERLTGQSPGADRVAATQDAASRFDAVVLLKGSTTIIAAPDGQVLVNPSRSSWPATAGSGDVLTGVIGALLASGRNPAIAAAAAAHVHALAATLAATYPPAGTRRGQMMLPGAPVPASGIQAALTQAIREVRAVAGMQG
jgi:ADP-dependent NAD(P)H-hydrate dehydratase / NAD(P)H-hydrate epimerase